MFFISFEFEISSNKTTTTKMSINVCILQQCVLTTDPLGEADYAIPSGYIRNRLRQDCACENFIFSDYCFFFFVFAHKTLIKRKFVCQIDLTLVYSTSISIHEHTRTIMFHFNANHVPVDSIRCFKCFGISDSLA